jgi:hypothetical protein
MRSSSRRLGFDRVKGLLVAKIPKVPDFVSLAQWTGRGGGKPSVGIGDYGDEHEEFYVL